MNTPYTFYEFFAGGGMARSGLGPKWNCLFANDFDGKKATTYKNNWGAKNFLLADINDVRLSDFSQQADLAWASFPCQDLSLAGGGAGLKGERSGTFWPFWQIISDMRRKGEHPPIVVLENVCGALTSHSGKDFQAICNTLHKQGYNIGALVVDAAHFLPQSRPRLFVVGVQENIDIPARVLSEKPNSVFFPRALKNAYDGLVPSIQKKWLWWKTDVPNERSQNFSDLIEDEPTGTKWHSPEETENLLSMMSAVNLTKVEKAQNDGVKKVGAIYKRTRRDEIGRKVQRAEVRFDDLAGCLRTPAGGSSRQLILVVEKDTIRSRLISTRETARLMGLPDSYELPDAYNEAYHLTGDGVAVPVVSFLARQIIEPILDEMKQERIAA
jgi:DNA (cytosine-5)-methyltransferase 1